jgi:hypothetical protein
MKCKVLYMHLEGMPSERKKKFSTEYYLKYSEFLNLVMLVV